MTDLPRYPARIEHWTPDGSPGEADAPPGIIVICEHASNALPVDCPALGADLGLDAETRVSHAAWDIGALGLSRALAPQLARACGGAVLVHAPLSRLVFDLNRPPDHPGAMPETSEVHAIPGNRNLSTRNRRDRVQAIRQPFHDGLAGVVADLVVRGRRPTLVAVHSFTPVYHGVARAVEFGILYDRDEALAQAIFAASGDCGLLTRLNEPYNAQGDVAHTIRVHSEPLGLRNTMLELRNDLITTPAQQQEIGDRLGPVLIAALAEQGLATPAS